MPPDMQILEVLAELSAKRCGCVLVVCSLGKLLGTFTDGDLRRSLQKLGAAVRHASPVRDGVAFTDWQGAVCQLLGTCDQLANKHTMQLP